MALSSFALPVRPSSTHARIKIMNEISVGITAGRSSLCMLSKTRKALSTLFPRTNAPSNAL